MEYLNAFILHCFKDKPLGLRPAQLFHVLNGKRTASTLYQALNQGILQYFSLFTRLERDKFDYLINRFIEKRYLAIVDEKTLMITREGNQLLIEYFKDNIFPNDLHQERYARVSDEFFGRIILLTQVLSEKMHKNKAYNPAVNRISSQRYVKTVLRQHNKKDELSILFKKEWLEIGRRLESPNKELVAWQLSGHKLIGLPLYDIYHELEMNKAAGQIMQLNSIHALLEAIDEDTPLFDMIKQDTLHEYHYNLSHSAWNTYLDLQNKLSIEEIAQRRGLKPSTINDHIIEIAILTDDFSWERFIPNEDELYKLLKDDTNQSFRSFKEKAPEIPFLSYRLAQIKGRKENLGLIK